MDLTTWLESIPWYVLPIVVFVLTVLSAVMFRPKSARQPVVKAECFDDRARLYDTTPIHDEQEPVLAEKRTKLRRDGNPVPIRMSMELQGERSEEAFVIDRSTGGMRIWTKRRVQSGVLVRVKAENAPEGTPWVFLQVCRVSKNRKFYELGCQFTQEVPWNILLLFG